MGRRVRRGMFCLTVLVTGNVGMLAGQAAEPYAADLERARVTVEQLGSRFVGPDELRDGPARRDIGALLENHKISGLRVARLLGNPGKARCSSTPAGRCSSASASSRRFRLTSACGHASLWGIFPLCPAGLHHAGPFTASPRD